MMSIYTLINGLTCCQHRHVILNDGFCVHCSDPDEDVLHALFQCDRVRKVREADNLLIYHPSKLVIM